MTIPEQAKFRGNCRIATRATVTNSGKNGVGVKVSQPKSGPGYNNFAINVKVDGQSVTDVPAGGHYKGPGAQRSITVTISDAGN